MKRKWDQIAARPRTEQAGTRLVVPAKRWKWKRFGCRRCTLSKIELGEALPFRHRCCFAPSVYALVQNVHSIRADVGGWLMPIRFGRWKRAPGIRYC